MRHGLYQLQPASPSTSAQPLSSAAVLWTILTTKEYPPDDLDAFRQMKKEKTGLASNAKEIVTAIRAMPQTMRQLAPVQLLTWLGLFCMWLYFPVAVARNVFGAPDTSSPLYAEGVEWGGICFAVYSAVCFAFSLVLPVIANKLGRKNTHSLCLLCGALGLISVAIIHDKYILLLTMVGVGIAWASTLSMPYAVLAGSLPSGKTGVYMGIFNFFIVIPEILCVTVLRMGHEPSAAATTASRQLLRVGSSWQLPPHSCNASSIAPTPSQSKCPNLRNCRRLARNKQFLTLQTIDHLSTSLPKWFVPSTLPSRELSDILIRF